MTRLEVAQVPVAPRPRPRTRARSALGGRPLAQRRLRDAPRRHPLRPPPCRDSRGRNRSRRPDSGYLSRDLWPVALRPPLAAGKMYVVRLGVVDDALRQRSSSQASRLQAVNRGPAFRLARKGFPHGRPRRSPGGPERSGGAAKRVDGRGRPCVVNALRAKRGNLMTSVVPTPEGNTKMLLAKRWGVLFWLPFPKGGRGRR